MGIYSTRNLTDILGKNYVANLTSDFRPDGRAVAEKWEAMHDAKACLRCHDPLQAHGGARREVKLCVLCHSPQTIDPDTGNTVDFKVMVHKIHRGKNLPSVKAGKPYIIIGNAQRVFDFSTVADPQDLRNCETCHEPTAAEAHIAFTRPNRAACASCHDDVNFETGANHVAGPQADDRACASCHRPQGDVEFDASVKGAHTIPEESTQLKGLKTEIMSVDSAAPGRKPVVTFKVTNGDGSIVNPSSLASMQLLLGGPTTDNSTYVRENARTAPFNGTTATYTFTAALPADAKGTWMISADSYRNVTLNPDTPKALTLREAAANPITYVPVTDAQPKARRTVVNLDKCQKCHERLALHGGQRFVIEECVICHNPNEDDRTRRPPDKMPAESVDFKRLIHRLHRGEELTQDFTVYGFTANPVTSPNPVNFNEVRYPGDLRNCQTCHTTTSYKLPSPGILPTATKRDYYTPMQPGAAACLGCHDNRAAAAHAFVQTAPFGEACESCHGNNSEFSVDRVHAR